MKVIQSIERSVQRLSGHFSLSYEGIKESENQEKLNHMYSFLRSWQIPYKKLEITETPSLLKIVKEVEVVADNLSHLKSEWNNPMILYDEQEKATVTRTIQALYNLMRTLYSMLLQQSNLLFLYYEEVAMRKENEYHTQGISFLYTKKELQTYILEKHLATDNQEIKVVPREEVEANLQQYFSILIEKELYTISIGEYDIVKYNEIIDNHLHYKLSDMAKAKLLFYLDTKKLLDLKKKHILSNTYLEKLEEEVINTYKYVVQEEKQLTLEDVPHMINQLAQDIIFKTDMQYIPEGVAIIKILHSYPNETILQIEYQLANKDIPLVYEQILHIVCEKLQVVTEVTAYDIESALSYNLFPYKTFVLPRLVEELTEEGLQSIKLFAHAKEDYYTEIREYFHTHSERIIAETEKMIFTDSTVRIEEYLTVIENIKYTTKVKKKHEKLAKELKKLQENLMKENINFSFLADSEHPKYLIEVTYLGELLLFECSPEYIVDMNNVAVIYNKNNALQEFRDKTFMYAVDNSDVYRKVVNQLIALIM